MCIAFAFAFALTCGASCGGKFINLSFTIHPTLCVPTNSASFPLSAALCDHDGIISEVSNVSAQPKNPPKRPPPSENDYAGVAVLFPSKGNRKKQNCNCARNQDSGGGCYGRGCTCLHWESIQPSSCLIPTTSACFFRLIRVVTP